MSRLSESACRPRCRTRDNVIRNAARLPLLLQCRLLLHHLTLSGSLRNVTECLNASRQVWVKSVIVLQRLKVRVVQPRNGLYGVGLYTKRRRRLFDGSQIVERQRWFANGIVQRRADLRSRNGHLGTDGRMWRLRNGGALVWWCCPDRHAVRVCDSVSWHEAAVAKLLFSIRRI